MRKLLAVAVTFFLATGAHVADAAQRLALIVTNERYPLEVGALAKAHADGDIIGRALHAAGFDVQVVKDANKTAMLDAVVSYAERLDKAGPDAVGFFYFSGHGAATDKFGDNYLIPTDARIGSQLQLTALSVKLGDIVDTLAQTSAQTNFVVIDACRNVAFSVVRGGRGFKPEAERKGMLIAFSTEPGNVAIDDNIFSAALAEQIVQPGRETLQVFRAVRLKVLDATDNRQFPWTRDGLLRDFWFSGQPAPDPVEAQLRSSRMLAEWEAIRDSADAAVLAAFEQKYPGELLSSEARRRRLALPQVAKVERASAPGTPIVVWTVFSSRPGEVGTVGVVPARLERRAAELGHQIEIKVVPESEFAGKLFGAMTAGTQPDIISHNNYNLMDGTMGIRTSAEVRKSLLGVAEVLGELDPGRPVRSGGWQFLLKGSRSHYNARALVEDLVECDRELTDSTSADFAELRRVSEAVAARHVECRSPDSGDVDPERLATSSCPQDRAPVRVKSIRTCTVAGNDRLAFVSTVAAIDGPDVIGRRSVTSVLRKTDRWRVLAVAVDPVSAGEFASDVVPFARRLSRPSTASLPAPRESAAIQTPDGSFPEPNAGARFGDFLWKGSPSPEIRGEIAEFNYGYDTRLFLYPGSAPGQERQLSAGQLWTTKTPWVWRVWSITGNGDVVFSDMRQFRH